MNRDVRRFLCAAALVAPAVYLCLAVSCAPSAHTVAGAGQSSAGTPQPAGGAPPLVIDEDDLLLLDDPAPKAAAAPPAKVADNFACLVCHINYRDEPLARTHAEARVGCADCHGESTEHKNDEDNTTPPDVMFPADRIDALCDGCHDTHDAPAVKVIQLWLERCKDKKDPADLVCTDCHGTHRLARRSVRWDRNTRALIRDDPPAEQAPDAGPDHREPAPDLRD